MTARQLRECEMSSENVRHIGQWQLHLLLMNFSWKDIFCLFSGSIHQQPKLNKDRSQDQRRCELTRWLFVSSWTQVLTTSLSLGLVLDNEHSPLDLINCKTCWRKNNKACPPAGEQKLLCQWTPSRRREKGEAEPLWGRRSEHQGSTRHNPTSWSPTSYWKLETHTKNRHMEI